MPTKYKTKIVDGELYADPLDDDTHLVKVYDLPAKEDLASYIRMMESFERRFLHTADRGYEVFNHPDDLDDFIASKRKVFEVAEGGVKELSGGELCMAVLHRGIVNAKKHMQMRIDGVAEDNPQLKELFEKVGNDLNEGLHLFSYVRRKRGHPDVDDVLNEMKGEPYNIFRSTFGCSDDVLRMWHDHRIWKTAMAMKTIDRVAEVIAPLAASHAQFRDAKIPEMLREMVAHAKYRMQYLREDPAFKEEDDKLRMVRNAIQSFAPKLVKAPDHLPDDHPAQDKLSPTAVHLVKEAADLIYDMSVIRGHRTKSTALLKSMVEEQMQAIGPDKAVRGQ